MDDQFALNKTATILVVDDEKHIRSPLINKLQEIGHCPFEAENAETALHELKQRPFQLAILDTQMPGRGGLDILPEIRTGFPDTSVIAVMQNINPKLIVRCLQEGAHDYLIKPFDFSETLQSIDIVFRKRQFELVIKKYQQQLQGISCTQAKQLHRFLLEALESLISFIESKDIYTRNHSLRVAELSLLIGRRLQFTASQIQDLRWGALLHDVGKIAVDPAIQNQPRKLTFDEYRQIMSHANIGYEIVKPISNSSMQEIIIHHHDLFNGSRPDQSLCGDKIPLGARIVAVADAFEAMTSARPYRRSMSFQTAIYEIQSCSGKQFDPLVVNAFQEIPEQVLIDTIARKTNSLYASPDIDQKPF